MLSLPNSKTRAPAIVAGVSLLLWLVVLFQPWLDPDRIPVGMDFLNLTYPRFLQSAEAFSQGEIPLWNWMHWGGAPLLATSLGSVLYPPMWAAFLFPTAYALQLFAFAHIVWLGWGTMRFYRILKLPHAAIGGATAALFVTGNAFLLNRLDQVQVIATLAWAPWIVMAGRNVMVRNGNPVPFIVCVAMALLAGHTQYTLIVLAFIALVSAGEMAGLGFRAVAKGMLRPAGFSLIGVAVAAPQILPTMELSALSERIWPWADLTSPHLSPTHLVGWLMPMWSHDLANVVRGRPLGHTEQAIYGGGLWLPLALLGLIISIRSKSRPLLVLLATAAIFFVAAFGKNVPGWETIWANLPIWKQTRGAARLLLPVILVASLAAGYGIAWIYGKKLGRVIAPLLLVTIAAQQYLHHSNYWPGLLGPESLVANLRKPSVQAVEGNLYRFMTDDSRLYLSDKPGDVYQRITRPLPNLNSIQNQPVLGGYEEGLLPTRAYANFMRKYNRNLRNADVDAPLLALLRSNTIETDFPPPVPGADWREQISSRMETATYQSEYQPAVAIAPALLTEVHEKPEDIYGTNEPVRLPSNNSVHPHPVANFPPDQWNAARLSANENFTWNRLTFNVSADTTHAMVLVPPYPGWKVEAPSQARLQPMSAIFYHIYIEPLHHKSSTSAVALNYAPFSFRMGLFAGLTVLCLIFHATLSRLALSRKGVKVT